MGAYFWKKYSKTLILMTIHLNRYRSFSTCQGSLENGQKVHLADCQRLDRAIWKDYRSRKTAFKILDKTLYNYWWFFW